MSLCLVVALIGGWEWFWRTRAFFPTVNDDSALWSAARARAHGDAAILIGTSRIQVAVDPDAFAKAIGVSRVAQLSISGNSSLPVLEDLADDPKVTGLVICDFAPIFSLDGEEERTQHPRSWIKRYHDSKSSPAQWVEHRLSLPMQERFVFRSSYVSPVTVLQAAVGRGWPNLPGYTPTANRFMPIDFSRVDLPQLKARLMDVHARVGRPATPEELDGFIARINKSVDKLEGRGARVLFVALNATGELRKLEDERYPRDKYWDVLASRGKGQYIHEDDHPSLSFDCPDGSHIDAKDAPAFTAALAEIVKK